MKYNILALAKLIRINLFDITEDELNIVVDSYLQGKVKLTLSGTTYAFDNIREFQIFTNESSISKKRFNEQLEQLSTGGSDMFGRYYTTEDLEKYGQNITSKFIGHNGYGDKKISEIAVAIDTLYVNPKRIEELESTQSSNFDLSRLISMCKELNDNWSNQNYFSVALLVRSILNHIPPLFGEFKSFDQVAAHYIGASFKKSVKPLNESFRSIADSYAHGPIRKKEPLPNMQQVDYRPNFDVLLVEIIAIMHT